MKNYFDKALILKKLKAYNKNYGDDHFVNIIDTFFIESDDWISNLIFSESEIDEKIYIYPH